MQGTFAWRTTMVILTALSFMTLSLIMLQNAGADAPFIGSVSFSPTPPDVDSPLNISVNFELKGEPIRAVSVQSCSGGICDIPVPMQDDGSGTLFFYEFHANKFGQDEVFVYFHFFIEYGTSSSVTIPEDPESHDYNVTLLKLPKELFIAATIDSEVVFPDQAVTVNGKVRNDLGKNVSSASVTLQVWEGSVSNDTTTDEHGDFELSVPMTMTGNNTVNLTAEKDGLYAYQEWTVRVDMWPLPRITIETELSYEPSDLPSGSNGSTFYIGSDVEILYSLKNLGSGDALNVTAIISNGSVDGGPVNTTIGTLPRSGTYEGSIDVDSSLPGTYNYSIKVEFDQTAPNDLKIPVTPLLMELTFAPRPVWTGHRPLVEMFTQTTCAPCVFMEEAVERLKETLPEEMDLVMYVFEDEASKEVFQENGVTSTPEVLIDRTFERIRGIPSGEDVEGLIELVKGSVDDAASREVPPLALTISVNDTNATINVVLMDEYSENFTGKLTVYEVEPFSNLRNNIGIPIGNRFKGTAGEVDLVDLRPGGSIDLVLPPPGEGMSYIAFVRSIEGSAVQCLSFIKAAPPELYVREDVVLRTLMVPGQTAIPLELERFGHESALSDDVPFTVTPLDLPSSWSLGPALSGPWTNGTVQLTFDMDDSNMTTLPVGRIRWNTTVMVHIRGLGNLAPEDIGLKELSLRVSTERTSYDVTALMDVRNGTVPEPHIANITDHYLKGEDLSIFLYVRVMDLPPNATVRGSVVPCFYGDDARCGVPKYLVLQPYSGDLFRAPVLGNDILEFTHLTYTAWIEIDDERVVETQPVTVEIATLINLTSDDDDDDGPRALMVIGASIFALIFLAGAVILLILLVRRTSNEYKGDLRTEEGVEMATDPPTEPPTFEPGPEPVPGPGAEGGIVEPTSEGDPSVPVYYGAVGPVRPSEGPTGTGPGEEGITKAPASDAPPQAT